MPDSDDLLTPWCTCFGSQALEFRELKQEKTDDGSDWKHEKTQCQRSSGRYWRKCSWISSSLDSCRSVGRVGCWLYHVALVAPFLLQVCSHYAKTTNTKVKLGSASWSFVNAWWVLRGWAFHLPTSWPVRMIKESFLKSSVFMTLWLYGWCWKQSTKRLSRQ